MHPLIHVVSFLVFASWVATGDVEVLLFSMATLVSYGLFFRINARHKMLQMLKRTRWFFLSMVVIYFWFTPGDPVWPEYASYSPTWSGLQFGLTHIAALAILVCAVALLLTVVKKEQLVSVCYRLAFPFKWLGLSPVQFATRFVLTIDAVTESKTMLNKTSVGAEKVTVKAWIARLAGQSADYFRQVQDSETAHETLVIALDTMPAMVQWLVPCGLMLGFWWLF